MSGSLFNLFRRNFPSDLSRTFLETEAGLCLSYADMLDETARLARFFAGLGLVKGDCVVSQVEKSPAALLVYLACLRAGLVHLPLNTAYRADEVAYFLADAQPRCMICTPEAEATVRRLGLATGLEAVFTLDEAGCGSLTASAQDYAGDFEDVPCAEDDIAAILYSSGTTGKPKGAMLSHRNLAANAQTLVAAWGFSAEDVLLHALPLFHAHGLFVACHCALVSGCRMLFLERFERGQVIDLLPHATVFMGIPTYYTRLLAGADFGREACRSMRLFISGSAPLLAETFNAFEARTGLAILERYGMTETVMNTSNPLNGPRRAGTVGPPLAGVSVRVVDEEGRELPLGEIGQLLVKGPNVFSGYWRMPEKTAQDFTTDGFFRTGDLACIDDLGYVSIVGRGRDMVICGGFNVYPKEVEDCLDRLDGIEESAVIGLPHADFGEAVVAVVKPKAGARLDEAAIIAAMKDRLANFKVPKRVMFVAELPRNAMGKVQKNLLRETFGRVLE